MSTVRRSACAVTLMLGLTACGSAEILTDRSLATRFNAWRDNMPTIGGAFATAAAGEVAVVGVFTTPYPCYELQGRATLQSRQITALVDARRVGEACAAVIARTNYRLTALGLASGAYSVSVHHRTIDERGTRDSTVAEFAVIVR